jgi:hypothetical protein
VRVCDLGVSAWTHIARIGRGLVGLDLWVMLTGGVYSPGYSGLRN